MAYTALVNLGPTIGIGITSVKLYECSGNNSGCTALANYTNVPVSSFPYAVTGITDSKKWIKVEPVGACSGTTQNFEVSGFPAPTATPGPTATPSPTPTSTAGPGPTATPTATPTRTPTPTPTSTSTPTPTPTATTVTYGCGDTVSDTYTPSTFIVQTKYLDLSEATDGDTITISYTANDRPNRFNIYGNGMLVENSGWAGSDNTYAGPWGGIGTLTDPDGTGSFTFEYQAGMSYELRVDVGPANPNASPTPNPSDGWSVTIGCSSPSPLTFSVTTGCTNYAGTLTVNITGGGTGSGYYWSIISGPEGFPTGNQSDNGTVTGLTNGNYAILVGDSSGPDQSTNEDYNVTCASAPNNTAFANLVISSTKPSSSQCSSGTGYTFDLGSPSATFCNATTFTASGLTGLGTGNNYWLCYDGQTRQMFHPSNAGYFQQAGSCQTI
jgi:hypothetical protein